jgi:hypothetical protein
MLLLTPFVDSLPTGGDVYVVERTHFDVAHDGTFEKIQPASHSTKNSGHSLDVSHLRHYLVV